MCSVKYMCQHCKKGHSDIRHVEMCSIAAKDNVTPDDVLRYVTIRDELLAEKIIHLDTRPKNLYTDTFKNELDQMMKDIEEARKKPV